MADEIQVQSNLQVKKTNTAQTITLIEYRSQPTNFTVDMAGAKGPTPGSILVSTEGTDVDLSELTTPGLCRVQNQDGERTVMLGIWDPEGVRFYPLIDLLPGESYVFRLSALLQEEIGTGSGTGTDGANTNRMRLKAITANANCLVEAFEL